MKLGKNDEYKLRLTVADLVQVLNKYQDVVPPKEPLALNYETTQLYYALEALRLFMEDRMIEPNYEVIDEQNKD